MNSNFFTHKTSCSPKTLVILSLMIVFALSLPAKRALAASITVNSTADTTIAGDTQCTLREAVANANSDSDTTGGDCVAGSGTDTIGFTSAVLGQTITLSGSEITLSSNMTISADVEGLIISGNNASRIFTVNSGSNVTLTNLRITDGNVTGNGGGIQNLGTLTINNSTIDSNQATVVGGGVVNGVGASLTLNSTTLHSNVIASISGTNAGGGGLSNSGTAVLNNVTIHGNSASGGATSDNGGGIRNVSGATITLNNVTVINNTTERYGGGISNAGGITLHNTILAYNLAGVQGPDCRGPVTINASLIRTTTNCTITNQGGSLLNVDPLLTSLDANGGGSVFHPALTAYPRDDSPVLNAGNNSTCLATDQRGNPRPVGNCDMGAVEKQAAEEVDHYCGTWVVGTPHVFGSNVNVTITPNTISDTNACVTVVKRPVFPGLNQNNGEFPIIWTVATAANANITYNLDMDFCYTSAELTTSGVTDENTIVVYHHQNGSWQAQTTTPDPANNCVGVSGITSLSPWTIVGNGNAPTAIQLQNLTVRTAASPQGFALVLVALLGLVAGVGLIRSRR
ncbi:MAG: hypothetical protein Fur0022_41640 [Anaerolineales bacterium]